MFHKIYHTYSDINNKEEKYAATIITSMLEQEEDNKVKNDLKTHMITMKKINLSCKKLSSLLISMISNQ